MAKKIIKPLSTNMTNLRAKGFTLLYKQQKQTHILSALCKFKDKLSKEEKKNKQFCIVSKDFFATQ
jgi:hypothetical protein